MDVPEQVGQAFVVVLLYILRIIGKPDGEVEDEIYIGKDKFLEELCTPFDRGIFRAGSFLGIVWFHSLLTLIVHEYLEHMVESDLQRRYSSDMIIYPITEEEAERQGFLYEEPERFVPKTSFIQFAQKLLQLKEGDSIEFQTEADEGYAWAALKLRLLDADIIVFGIYGGGDTYLYDMTGDGDSPTELQNYLSHCLQCHTSDGVYLK